MAFLKPRSPIFISILVSAHLLTGCGEMTMTQTLPLETDTFISSDDPANHSELSYLQLSKSATREDRVISRFPTSDKEPDESFAQIFDLGLASFFFMPLGLIGQILSCQAEILRPENLVSADLIFEIQQDHEGSLNGKIRLQSLTKPWWQTVSWSQAHPFSSRGVWDHAGGDLDPDFTPIPDTADATSIHFDVTQYFRDAIEAGGVAHYGFLLESAGAALQVVRLKSKQYGKGPRVVATYQGHCDNRGGNGYWTGVYYLGSTHSSR